MTNTSASPRTSGARRVEIFTGAGHRRAWSGAEKARIVAECDVPGVRVSEVARRHGLCSSQLFRWRRSLKAKNAEIMRFAPVVIAEASSAAALPTPVPESSTARIEVDAQGIRVRLPAGARPGLVAAVVKALRARP